MSKKSFMSKEQLANYVKRHPGAKTKEVMGVLNAAKRGDPPANGQNGLQKQISEIQSHRSGSRSEQTKTSFDNVENIIKSVNQSVGHSKVRVKKAAASVSSCSQEDDGPVALDEVVFWFDGARSATYNQIVSMLQRKLPQYFRYKKAWKIKIQEQLLAVFGHRPHIFEGKVEVELLRQSYRRVDWDGVTPIFKIMIDSMRGKENGIIKDDSPDYVLPIVTYQRIIRRSGPSLPGVGVRIKDACDTIEPCPPDPIKDWLNL